MQSRGMRRGTLARERIEKSAEEPTPMSAQGTPPQADRAVDLSDLTDHLGFYIRRAQLWVFKDVRRRLAEYDISPAQYSVMTIVAANPGINQQAVASALDIERAGLGRLLERLERRNLIKRAASPIDRRAYVLQLTSAGSSLVESLKPLICNHDTALAKRIGSDRYDALKLVLSTFAGEEPF